mgnify:FL=1
MNIGVIFHNLATDERRLETITKWSRLKNFDDEINLKFFKILIDGMSEEIQNNLFNDSSDFDLREYTKMFYNELLFSDIYEDSTEDFEEFVEYTKKNFLRYDYDKKQRLNRDQQIKYMKSYMKSNNIKYSVKSTEGKHLESIKYDYIINDYAFKFFTFENKKLDYLISSSKAWAYTANEMRDKYKTVFVYDSDIDSSKFLAILEILKSAGFDVIKIDDTIDYVENIYKEDIMKINNL